MNNSIAKYLFFFLEYLRLEDVRKYLANLESNQYLTREELSRIQREKLIQLIRYVIKNNDYFKAKYDGYDPITSFHTLPCMTKDELRAHLNDIITCPKNKKRLDLVKTSGSTGMPLMLYRDRIVFGYNLAAVYRGHRWHGLDIGSKEAMLWGIPVDWRNRLGVRFRDFLLNRFREKKFNLEPSVLMDFYKKIIKKKADYIYGYTSMVYEFALLLKNMNLKLGNHMLKGAVCTAETIHDYQRSVIEEVLGCKVISEYGSTETGIISFECKEGRHHVPDDCVYVEVVDDDNLPVPMGQTGKILVTVLHSFSFPIIRYQLGDYVRMSDDTCPCGVNLSIIDQIMGRTNDIIVTPQGRCFHSIAIYYIMKEFISKFGGIKQFKVRQTHISKLEMHIIRTDSYNGIAEGWLSNNIKNFFGKEMSVNFIYHESFQRSESGKLQDFETCLDTSNYLVKNINRLL